MLDPAAELALAEMNPTEAEVHPGCRLHISCLLAENQRLADENGRMKVLISTVAELVLRELRD
jgi:hypothetical protein